MKATIRFRVLLLGAFLCLALASTPFIGRIAGGDKAAATDEAARFSRGLADAIRGVDGREGGGLIGKAGNFPEGLAGSGHFPADSAERIRAILSEEDASDEEVASRLFAVSESLAGEDQLDALLQGILLLDESEYERVFELLSDESARVEIHEIAWNDLLSRSEYLQFPIFLDLSRRENHPYRSKALKGMKDWLGIDHGRDWEAWQGAIDVFLDPGSQERTVNQLSGPAESR